jgi:hypothetical protein
VVYVATEHDSVFAFDADSNTGGNSQPLWHTSFLSSGVTTVSDNYCTDISPEYGITGTPAIDTSANILYAVSETYEGGNYVKRLHALDIASGLEKPGSPVVITASVTVPGQSAVTFNPQWENQRNGLLFYNGTVYIGFGSHCDGSVWQGWILGYTYNGTSLTQTFVYTTEPSSVNGAGAGLWNSGQGLAMDTASNLFLGTGNGQFDTNLTPPLDYGDSVIRIDLSKGPTVQDYFAPGIQSTLNSQNQDMGSGGVAILPPQPGPFPNLLVIADKFESIYVVNRDNLGHYSASSDNVVQELNTAVGRMFSSPIYFNGKVYFWGASDVLKAFTMTNGMLSTTPTDQGPDVFGFPGAVPTISANGTSNAILWALRADGFRSSGPAVLYAYVPGSLSTGSIYNSNQNASRDNPGGAIKFAVPTVANGKVYVGAINQLSVYGELANTPPAITSANSTTFTVGTAGSFSVTATGTPTPALSESGVLPTGVTFHDNGNGTGTLSGTPANGTAGSYALTFTANNGVGTAATQSFTLTVNNGGTPPAITSANSTTFTVGTAGSFSVTATGTPTPALSESGALPSGVTFHDNGNGTGTLSGTPASGTAGSYAITFKASNGVGTAATQSFTLTVNNGGTPPAITSANSTTFTVGTAGSFSVTATGTPTPALSESGALPTGVTFHDNGNGTGTLSGTPASGTAGSYALTFTANNGVGTPASQSFTLTVSGGGGGGLTWGQMDAWLQMNTSTPGTTLTPSILAAGTVGGVLTPQNFGETGIAGTPSGNGNIVLATPFVTGSDTRGYIPVSVSGYNGGVSTAANFDLGIYADNSGSPGALLCHTGTTSLTPGVWNFITLSLSGLGCPTLNTNTQYWAAYITSSNSIGQSYASGTCPGTSLSSVKTSAAQGSAVLPGSFGANTVISSQCYSLYVTAAGDTGSLTWSLFPNTPTGFVVAASQGSLGGSVTVNGTTYPNGTTTQSLALDHSATPPIYASTTSSITAINGAVVSTVVANGYVTPGPANSGHNGGNFAKVSLIARNGDYVILQLNNGNADGSGNCYCVRIETNGGSGGGTIYSSPIKVSPNHRYSYSLLFDEVGGVAKLAMYDPSNGFAQVGTTLTVAQTKGGSFGELWIGNAETGKSPGNTTYFEDTMLDWTNHIFPNYPH